MTHEGMEGQGEQLDQQKANSTEESPGNMFQSVLFVSQSPRTFRLGIKLVIKSAAIVTPRYEHTSDTLMSKAAKYKSFT